MREDANARRVRALRRAATLTRRIFPAICAMIYASRMQHPRSLSRARVEPERHYADGNGMCVNLTINAGEVSLENWVGARRDSLRPSK